MPASWQVGNVPANWIANWISNPRHHPRQPARALYSLSDRTVRTHPQESAMTGITTHAQVGKTFANWTPIFANWIQLADLCQLNSHMNQSLSSKLASWQVGNAANLPTELSACQATDFGSAEVGEISPSYYVGEGTKVPSDLRGGSALEPRQECRRATSTAVLALDLGTQTGWALRGRDDTVISGSESFKPHRFEGGGMRYLRFKRWLTEVKQSADLIGAVFFEEVRRHAGVDAAHAYGGFMAHLTAWCEHHQIPYQGVPVGTIKRHATGKGNAGKQDVIAAVRRRGYRPADDNEADALALLHWALDTQEL
jgi:hypothetical protein